MQLIQKSTQINILIHFISNSDLLIVSIASMMIYLIAICWSILEANIWNWRHSNVISANTRRNKKDHLNTHINAVHLKLKLFKCEHCDYAASSNSNFLKHMKAKHLKKKPWNLMSAILRHTLSLVWIRMPKHFISNIDHFNMSILITQFQKKINIILKLSICD